MNKITNEQLERLIKSAVNSSGPLTTDDKFAHIISALRELRDLRSKLANREAQPVAFYGSNGAYYNTSKAAIKDGCEDVTPLYTSPPAPANANPVAWEMRYWNSGYNCWHDWERITAEQHAEMSVLHAADNDYEFRVLYDAPPAPAVPECFIELLKHAGGMAMGTDWNSGTAAKYHRTKLCEAVEACRAAMLQPVSSGYRLPPHVYRELVNSLRDTAVQFSGTEQLRERLNTTLHQFIEPDHPHTRTVAPEGGNDHDTRR